MENDGRRKENDAVPMAIVVVRKGTAVKEIVIVRVLTVERSGRRAMAVRARRIRVATVIDDPKQVLATVARVKRDPGTATGVPKVVRRKASVAREIVVRTDLLAKDSRVIRVRAMATAGRPKGNDARLGRASGSPTTRRRRAARSASRNRRPSGNLLTASQPPRRRTDLSRDLNVPFERISRLSHDAAAPGRVIVFNGAAGGRPQRRCC